MNTNTNTNINGKNGHNNDYVYFQLNDWFAGTDYPEAEPFLTWFKYNDNVFLNENWIKENKLCVSAYFVDMSIQFRIAAYKSWIIDNCPELLTTYKKFIILPDENGKLIDRFGYEMKYYDKSNIGLVYENIDL